MGSGSFTECAECGKRVQWGEVAEIGDKPVCEDCYATCDQCGEDFMCEKLCRSCKHNCLCGGCANYVD